MHDVLKRLGLKEINEGAACNGIIECTGEVIDSINPATGELLAKVRLATRDQYEAVMAKQVQAFEKWRMIPAPRRGEILCEVAQVLEQHKDDLGALVTMEMGKIRSEGLGEVQEAIDMAYFCVGLSRQLYGLAMHSERPEHRLYEQWHPLGVVGVITAFNFPVAVWAWNAMVAAACGDTIVWKPSVKVPLCAIATHHLCDAVFQKHGFGGVLGLTVGDRHNVGKVMTDDRRIPLISATGSCGMGRAIGKSVANRLARSILELGGNNAAIVDKSADLDLALRAVTFGAAGTAGQRCTSTRRLFLHEDIAEEFLGRLVRTYESLSIGDPMDETKLIGPLIDKGAVKDFENAIAQAKEQGGEVLVGGVAIEGDGAFVRPTVVKMDSELPIAREETFAPILYTTTFKTLDEAIAMQNGVDQGLSSSIFTDSFRSAETFLSHRGSDCGIANVNTGTSGAEIGGAFGGEKDTGGGREAGSDCWKAYMRRQTCTLNWGGTVPLAQGVKFDV